MAAIRNLYMKWTGRLAALRRRFATRPNFVQTRDGVARLAGRSAHAHWIVGRGLCMFRRHDFANVPKNRRRAAVELQLPVWSPFRRTGHHTVWQGSEAMVWFWDDDTVAAAQHAFRATPAGRDAPRAEDLRALPETVFLPRQDDGALLQPCRVGFELQRWRDGVLEEAFWYPDRPDDDQLDSFLSRQGVPDATAARTVQNGAAESLPAEHAAEPWASPGAPIDWLRANERNLAAGAILLLAVAAIWQETRYWKIDALATSAQAQFETQQEALAPVLATRDEILALSRRNDALATVLNSPSQAYLMGLVDRAIPGETARFAEWHFQQGELEVLVTDDDALDPVAYVRALEAVPRFEAVRVGRSSRPDSVEIALRIRP